MTEGARVTGLLRLPAWQRSIAAGVLALCAAAAGAPAVAQEAGGAPPALPPKAEVQQNIANQLGVPVEVLDMQATRHGERPVLIVKVMNQGGDSNAAFMVSSLLVDAQSGAILGEVPNVAESDERPRFEPQDEGNTRVMRQRTYRGGPAP